MILGAGLYGLYSAFKIAQNIPGGGYFDKEILVIDPDPTPFRRAPYINQARVHMGYHYPRSFSTAIKSAHYFDRFMEDFSFCVLTSFDQIYATSACFSWTNAGQFEQFCHHAGIRCDRVDPSRYFYPGLCDGAFLTTEYTYDAAMLRDYFLEELKKYPFVRLLFGRRPIRIERHPTHYSVFLDDGTRCDTDFLLNATYAATNQVLALLGYPAFQIKYELCEIILCRVSRALEQTGITVMDGPFFSIMPFGKTGFHSLTSVTFTPHTASYSELPAFRCQKESGGFCSPECLGNCNDCPARPASAWPYMSGLARKYLKEEFGFEYVKSLFSMKPILKASEMDDSRPTVIRRHSVHPTCISVLSGKINTVYDLDPVLEEAFGGTRGESYAF